MSCSNYIYRQPTIIGAYLGDSIGVAPSQRDVNFWVVDDHRYLPIMNIFSLNNRHEFSYSDVNEAGGRIETYNRGTMYNNTISPKIAEYKRLDVTSNDLSLGGTHMLLNFLDEPVTVKTRFDVPKVYAPLVNRNLEEYKGKILVLTMMSFNTPAAIKEATGLVNYFDNLIHEKVRAGQKETVTCKVLEYLSNIWKTRKHDAHNAIAANSIRVVLMHEYKLSDFRKDAGGKTESFYCSESGIMVDRGIVVLDSKTHPKLSDDIVANRQIVETFRDNGISCFIVDNDNRIGERYTVFAGQPKLIPKVRDKNRPEGLYMISVNGDKSLNQESFIALDEIDNNRYVFKSQEEALIGTDIRGVAERDFEMEKIRLRKEDQRLKAVEQNLKVQDQLIRERMNKMEEYFKSRDLDRQNKLHHFKLEEEVYKQNYNREKYLFDTLGMESRYQYEALKYHRDSTIETMKTLGSIAGLVAGGYVLFKQLNKA